MNTIFKTKTISKKLFFFLAALFAFFQFITPLQASKPQCGQRYIAQNIKSAVLALKATKYCKSTILPYSLAEVSKRIDSLRCNAQASSLLDEMINNYDYQYKSIMSGTASQLACAEAAALGDDFS